MQAQEEYELPPTVYQYTGRLGLEGILKSRTFWMTDTGFLNDTSEMAYGNKLVSDLIKAEIELVKDPILKMLWSTVDIFFIENHFNTYVASFCHAGDALYPWIQYADNAKGFNIGVKTSFFKRLLKQNIGKKVVWTVGKATYGASDITTKVNQLCEICTRHVIRFLRNEFSKQDLMEFFATVSSEFTLKILPEICLIKNPMFEVENEFRIVGITRKTDSEYNLLYRGNNIPYIESEPLLPSDINSICIGSCNNISISETSHLLVGISEEYKNVSVENRQ